MILLLAILSIFVISINSTDIYILINDNTDNSYGDSTNCDNLTINCNLRSAWLYCNYISTLNNDKCVIDLSNFNTVYFNTYYGSLVLNEQSNIEIISVDNTIINAYYNQSNFISFYGNSLINSQTYLSIYNIQIDYFGSPTSYGGAIYISGNIGMNITNCVFINNIGLSGGAIYLSNTSDIIISYSTFISNRAFYDGGSIFIYQNVDQVIISNCYFYSSLSSLGGAIYMDQHNSRVNMNYLTISFSQSIYSGGCIFIGDSNVDIDISNSYLSDCTSDIGYGGGVYINDYNSYIYLYNNIIHNCVSLYGGGGIYINNYNYYISLSYSALSDSQSLNGAGGGIYISDSNIYITVYSSSLSSCLALTYGGGVYINNYNSFISLVDSLISESIADYDNGGGLHINSSNHDITIVSSTINHCTCLLGSGGGISLHDSNYNIEMTDLYIYNNSVYSQLMSGGGIYINNDNVDILIVSSVISKCSSSFGGAIYMNLYNQRVNISQTSIYDNYAVTAGGGIYIYIANKLISLLDLTFTRCYSYNGGGLSIYSNNSYVNLYNCSFDKTSSDYLGGAINVYTYNQNIRFVDIFISDSSSTYAAALYVYYKNSFIYSNGLQVFNCFAVYGGAIVFYTTNSHVHLTDTLLSEIHASQFGGGIYFVYYNTDVYIVNMLVKNCYANAGSGGAIFISFYNYEVFLIDITLVNCNSTKDGGAFIILTGNYDIYLSNMEFIECFSNSGSGGGLLIYEENVNIVVNNVSFISCSSGNDGGALYIKDNNFNISLNDLHINNCLSKQSGGGIAISGSLNIYLTNIFISNCKSYQYGGAIFITSASYVSIIRSTVQDCVSSYGGGGIALRKSLSYIYIGDSYIIGCQSTSGGGLYVIGPTNGVTVFNSTINTNNASSFGGGIYSDGPVNYQLIISGSRVMNNNANLYGGGIYLRSDHLSLAIMDKRLYNTYKTVQTSHPYSCEASSFYSVDNEPGTYIDTLVDIDEALGYIVIFDSQTSISDTDVIRFIHNNLNVYQYSSVYNNLPGISSPSLYLSVPSFNVIAQCEVTVAVTDNIYGVKMFVYPVFQETIHRSIIEGNDAISGGGLYVDSGNSFSLITNTEILRNSAVSGGGFFSRNDNIGTTINNVLFEENLAESNGGGGMLYSGLYGNLITNSSFVGNIAYGSGGGLGVGTGNGIGLFPADNQLIVSNCAFTNNSASSGGGMYTDNQNIVDIANSTFESNKALTEDGGALSAYLSNSIVISSSSFISNSASRCGGGVSSISMNEISLSNSNIRYNKASIGGGLCILDSSIFDLLDKIDISYNNASSIGGSISIFQSPQWSSNDETRITISHNFASKGSGLFIYGLLDSDNELRNIKLSDNTAAIGGTVYWIFDDVMSSEPKGLNSSTIYWSNNIAPYGNRSTTQPIHILVDDKYEVTQYNSIISPPIVVKLSNYYSELLLVSDDSISAIININDSLPINCFNQIQRIIGEDFVINPTYFQGNVSFNNIEIFCAPKGNLSLDIETKLSDVIGDGVSLVTLSYNYNLYATILATFRACEIGEIKTLGLCVPCSLGSYSLKEDSEVCTKCSSINGIQFCETDRISVSEGHWRRHNDTSTVLTCLLDPSSCVGGEATGDKLCGVGYEQALCAVCSQGYFLDNFICKQCKSSNQYTSKVILVIVVLVLIVITTMCLSIPSIRSTIDDLSGNKISQAVDWLTTNYRPITIKLKIALATYQIVTSSGSIFNIQLPTNFSKFAQALDILNLTIYGIVPSQCWKRLDFFENLFITTIVPIIITVALIVCYILERIFITNHYKGSYIRYDEKINKINNCKNKYLVFWFLLSYLVLPSISTMIFQSFVCTNIDPNNENPMETSHYLTADMSISCQSRYYKSWISYSIVMIFIYPIGITTIYLIFLVCNRVEISQRPNNETAETIDNKVDISDKSLDKTLSTRNILATFSGLSTELSAEALRLSFLWQSYRPNYWFWEIIETMRRLLLTAIVSIIYPGTSGQVVLSIILSGLCYYLYSEYEPYNERSDQILSQVGQIQIFMTFFIALIVQNSLLSNQWNLALGAVLIVINIAIVIIIMYFPTKEFLEYYNKVNQNEDIDRDIDRDIELVDQSKDDNDDINVNHADIFSDDIVKVESKDLLEIENDVNNNNPIISSELDTNYHRDNEYDVDHSQSFFCFNVSND